GTERRRGGREPGARSRGTRSVVPAGRRGMHPEPAWIYVLVATPDEHRIWPGGPDHRSTRAGRGARTREWVQTARCAGRTGRTRRSHGPGGGEFEQLGR